MPDAETEFSENRRKVYTVSRLNREVRRLLLDHFEPVRLEGEISNLSRPASGHVYFSLKDTDAQVRCAMFRGRNRTLDFKPENGMQVLVHARVDLYEVRGDFQLIVNFMEVAGRGELHRRFEEVKRKLAKEGLFEQARKRAIPEAPRRVGVITSKHGAALHDVLTTLKQRFPAIEVVVYPTPVQGDEAPASICRMIETANSRRETDVLILARGGGSLEDLWAFNEERVARAVAASALPIITGVGHEVDFTIADFVADDHAPTPTAAAQRASPDRAALLQNAADLHRRMRNRLTERIRATAQTLALQQSQLMRFHPATRIEQWMQKVDEAGERLHLDARNFMDVAARRLAFLKTALEHRAPLGDVRAAAVRSANAAKAMNLAAGRAVQVHRHRLEQLSARLDARNPLATLQRGYAIAIDERGRAIRSVGSVETGQKIEVRVADGRIDATVERLHREKQTS